MSAESVSNHDNEEVDDSDKDPHFNPTDFFGNNSE